MKVLGTAGDGKYLCEISHNEIDKFLGTYCGNTRKLSVGQEVDLGKGYDYKRDIDAALCTTKKFIEGNRKIIDAIMNGLTVASIRDEVAQ